MKTFLAFAATAAFAVASVAAQPASAHVATLSGAYDDTSHGEPYDTIELFFNNTSAFAFTGVTLTLDGYQPGSSSYLLVQSRSIPDIAASGTSEYVWTEATAAGNLFSYDYDDSNGVFFNKVGNFRVTFTATWDGLPIFSVFSPTSNVTGGFVGFEGLDPSGYSETVWDAHTGTPGGILAYIDVGTPGVPEPAVWALMLGGFGLVGATLRRTRRSAVTA